MGADVAPIIPDTYYSDVSILLHGDGTQGSTTIVDNSPTPSTFSLYPGGNYYIDTTTKVFGTGSLYLDGGVTTPNATKLDLTQGDFTFETRIRLYSYTGTTQMLASHRNSSGTNGWQIRISSTKKVVFWYTGGTVYTSTFNLEPDQWSALAITRSGTTLRMFLNGTLVDTFTGMGNGTSASSVFRIGANEVASEALRAYLDEYRITKGVARYTATYTLATTAFSNS